MDVFPGFDPDPVEILRTLIRFDTTNPPGREAPCLQYIQDRLAKGGLPGTLYSLDPDRPNLVVRMPGQGEAPPLLFYGHVDVAPTQNQTWTHPPFEGVVDGGWVWGRGALDMKGGVAMMMAAMLRMKAENRIPRGDVILAVVSDEEAGGRMGARFLVDEHPGLFSGVRWAVGEFGGFSLPLAGRRFYPIMIAEKQRCWLKAVVTGPGGHGSQIHRGGTMARVGRMLKTLDRARLPIHITPAVRLVIEGLTANLGFPKNWLLKGLLHPYWADRILGWLGEKSRVFEPMLRHTVNATVIRGGQATNVIPSRVELELDGRLLPGFAPYDLLRELKDIIGPEIDLEVVAYEPGPGEPDMGLFETLAGVMNDLDPDGRPVPLLMTGVSDARFFAQLGIQTYGFLPMNLPDDFRFIETIHAADERVPAEAVAFGAEALYRLLVRYGSEPGFSLPNTP